MIRWEYDKVVCVNDAKKVHRGRGGCGSGYICNACGGEFDIPIAEPGPLRVYVTQGDAHVCAKCVAPWLALISKFKIAPESKGVDCTDYTPPPTVKPQWCEACEDDARRVGEERRDRSWLSTLLRKAGIT